jgi:hypothetical protein
MKNHQRNKVLAMAQLIAAQEIRSVRVAWWKVFAEIGGAYSRGMELLPNLSLRSSTELLLVLAGAKS